MAEGCYETSDGLSEWLAEWDLSSLSEQLTEHGISSQDDFKYIESENQFQELLSSLDGLNFLQKCKLKKAWKSILPKPTAPPVQIHILGDEEKKILNTLNERYSNLSKDIEYIRKSFNDFNESIVCSKKNVNDAVNAMIVMINKRREELLNQIAIEKEEKQQLFNKLLNALDQMNQILKKNKDSFVKIGSNDNITSTERLEKLNQLLFVTGEDDEKKESVLDIVGGKCVVPDKLAFDFNQQSFATFLDSNMLIKSGDLDSEWNLDFKKIYGVMQLEQLELLDEEDSYSNEAPEMNPFIIDEDDSSSGLESLD